ncbi:MULTISPECIES: DUF5017 domain-containing protein [Sphingobacterium]|uniref:DUF5017 domain-containing protein n=1 Tax=Sphingobacterium TaxID=28453 RepID=UPI0013DBDD8D|nr:MULTISPECIES: DUF5017 domain-containing protein [unclassified Sphingobacterium]
MKKIRGIYALICCIALTACQKDEPNDINFDVNADKLEVAMGDSVSFNFNGSADIISFYSGEKGQEYVNRARTEAEGLGIQLTIASRVLYAVQNNLKLLVSTKFSGIYNAENIHEEDWIDITDKFEWSTATPGGIAAGNTNSGPINLTEYIVPGKPIYFGYRYESQAAATAATAGRTWRLPIFKLESVTEQGEANEIANVLTAGWKPVPIISAVLKPENTSYWTIRTSDPYLFFTPNSTLEPHLHWIITAPFSPTAIKPDKPQTIKAAIDKMGRRFRYAFKESGSYTVTFVAKNVNSHGEKEIVKELVIVVK